MSLQLNVTSYREAIPASPQRYTLNSGSASIGRLDSCDWTLPDPEKFLSGMHAVIEFTGNNYQLTDHSSNGVYLNDNYDPIGNGHSITIKHGDEIHLGEYSIRATITRATQLPAKQAPVIPDDEVFSDRHDPFSDLLNDPVGDIIDQNESGDLTAWDNELINNKPTVEIKIDKQNFNTQAPKITTEQDHEAVLNEAFNDYSRTEKRPEHTNTHPEATTQSESHSPSPSQSQLPEDWLNSMDFPSDESSDENSSDPAVDTNEFNTPDRLALLDNVSGDVTDTHSNSHLENSQMIPPDSEEHVDTGNRVSREATKVDSTGFIPVPEKMTADAGVNLTEDKLADTQVLDNVVIETHEEEAPGEPINKADAIAISRFLKSAGLEATPELVSMGPDIFDQIGSIFRTSIEGMREVIIARSKLKNELRLDATTIRSSGNNPIKFSMTTEDALIRLLSPKAKGYMPPETAIEEVVDDLKAHQVAMLAGMQSAFQSVLARFEPGLLEHRLQKEHPIGASIPLHKQAKMWKLFAELYDEIQLEATDDFSRLFGQAFGHAYEKQIWALKSQKIDTNKGDKS